MIAKGFIIPHLKLMNAIGFEGNIIMMLMLIIAGGPAGALKMLMLFALFGLRGM